VLLSKWFKTFFFLQPKGSHFEFATELASTIRPLVIPYAVIVVVQASLRN